LIPLASRVSSTARALSCGLAMPVTLLGSGVVLTLPAIDPRYVAAMDQVTSLPVVLAGQLAALAADTGASSNS
jgi:hypothetical protein